MEYQARAFSAIRTQKLSDSPLDRLSPVARSLHARTHVIDVHTHFFDILCVNKSYFILRMLKDVLGLKSVGGGEVSYSVPQAYAGISELEAGWADALLEELSDPNREFHDPTDKSKGVIDVIKAAKFLKFKTMAAVYDHYLDQFSLAKTLGMPAEDVFTTALMMDLEMGWGVKIPKSMPEQIAELQALARNHPVLPFLFCDPRRADISDPAGNLYALFDAAFCDEISFFGVKIYPALGYDPSDHRLWPIYQLCEQFAIPVLTHCGGTIVSTDQLELGIYEGDQAMVLRRDDREQMADALNDPARWTLVMEKFPRLKLCFGHFGGYDTWSSSVAVGSEKDPQARKETIIALMEKYPHVYADFSYNFIEVDLSKNLKNVLVYQPTVQDRTLFGTDYWVVNPVANVAREQRRFLEELDRNSKIKLSEKLTLENPTRFLFG